ncbi:MAG: hypothetical protein ACE5Q6_11370 [Dehalococcoidia bacterium]
MPKEPPDPPEGLWVITSYFNPMGYRSRHANYQRFRQHLNVPLLTVEMGHRGKFQLNREDATLLVQVPSQDIMWQKERLLNLALQALPSQCHTVVWLDNDILFERDDWPQEAVAALKDSVMVQLFSRVCALPREVDFSQPLAEQSYLERRSTASGLVQGMPEQNELGPNQEALKAQGMGSEYANGHAWVMRRELLEQAGFYDAMIVGGGDYVFLQAAIGQFEAVRDGHGWTTPDSRQYRHYLRWAEKFHRVVQGRIGLVPGDIYHLWHGELLDRQYLPRHAILTGHDFDPEQDISLDEHGCWRWNSDKPELHQAVRAYFQGRREDGRPVPP